MNETGKVQYKLLIPARLKAALEEAAHDNRRSLSAEIISRLELSFKGTAGEHVERELSELEDYEVIPNASSVVAKIDKLEHWVQDIFKLLEGSKLGDIHLPQSETGKEKRKIDLD